MHYCKATSGFVDLKCRGKTEGKNRYKIQHKKLIRKERRERNT